MSRSAWHISRTQQFQWLGLKNPLGTACALLLASGQAAPAATPATRRPTMNTFFNPTEIARNLTGLVAAVVLGTTLIAAAAGPAVVAGNGATPLMTAAAQSNIVASA
jgi:hypothetical protein